MTDEERLADYAGKINDAHDEYRQRLRSTIEWGVKAGGFLIKAKKIVKERQESWLDWLKANTKLKERTAQYYMKIAKDAGIDQKSPEYTVTTLASFYREIAQKEKERRRQSTTSDWETAYKKARTAIKDALALERTPDFFRWLYSYAKCDEFREWINNECYEEEAPDQHDDARPVQ